MERLYQSIHSDNREMEASDIVLGSVLATAILIVGAAFLWMLARNINSSSASRVTSWKRRLGRSIVPAIAVALLLRAFVVQTFWTTTEAAAPEFPRGSLVVVWKASRTFTAGELITYIYKGRVQVGRIIESGAETAAVSRNGTEPSSIPHSQIVGKVISVLWRTTPGVSSTGMPRPPQRGDNAKPAVVTEPWLPTPAPISNEDEKSTLRLSNYLSGSHLAVRCVGFDRHHKDPTNRHALHKLKLQ